MKETTPGAPSEEDRLTPPWIGVEGEPERWDTPAAPATTSSTADRTKFVVRRRDPRGKARARKEACSIAHRLLCDAADARSRSDPSIAAQLLRLADELHRRANR